MVEGQIFLTGHRRQFVMLSLPHQSGLAGCPSGGSLLSAPKPSPGHSLLQSRLGPTVIAAREDPAMLTGTFNVNPHFGISPRAT